MWVGANWDCIIFGTVILRLSALFHQLLLHLFSYTFIQLIYTASTFIFYIHMSFCILFGTEGGHQFKLLIRNEGRSQLDRYGYYMPIPPILFCTFFVCLRSYYFTFHLLYAPCCHTFIWNGRWAPIGTVGGR